LIDNPKLLFNAELDAIVFGYQTRIKMNAYKSRLNLALTILMVSWTSITIYGQTLEASLYQWQNVVIGGGGYVTGVVLSETEKDLIYSRTDVGGAQRWDAANNQWVQLLNHIGPGQSNLRDVESIATDPNDPNRLYIMAGESSYTRLLRSLDRGQTFTSLTVPFTVSGNGEGRGKGERLMVDSKKNNILFYGTRASGLYRSTDYGTSWKKVNTFPINTTADGVGICFIVFDKAASLGDSISVMYVGLSQKTNNLYKTVDGGKSWSVVTGTPANLQPHNAGIDGNGILYISFCDAAGPNGISAGAVWKQNTNTLEWTNITPPTGQGGFGGLGVDKNNPGTLIVSTLNRWWPGDLVYRSIDGGTTWKNMDDNSVRDASDAPYQYNGSPSTKLKAGNWIDNLVIDPFDSNRAMYVTGSGIWACSDASNCEKNQTVHWKFMVKGIEEMGATDLISPPSGAPLISTVGDCMGFRHTDLTVSPVNGFFTPPGWGSGISLDFAQNDPNMVVRTYIGGACGAYSINNGQTWTAFAKYPTNAGKWGDRITLSPDGAKLVWQVEESGPFYSHDNGKTWTASTGIPADYWYSLKSDRVNSSKFYVYHKKSGYVYTSTDGGITFAKQGFVQTWGGKINVCPTVEGDIWMPVHDGLYRSTNSGQSFTKLSNVQEAASITFGKAAPSKSYPTLFLMGKINNQWGFYASTDEAKSWQRINDDQHQYGYDGFLAGDESTFGRVFFSTHCMGIVYAQIQDCNAVWGGSAYYDNCSTCVAGNTGNLPCTSTLVDDNFLDREYTYSPNPFTKSILIESSKNAAYQIHTTDGRMVEQGEIRNSAEIGSQLSPGIYCVSIKYPNQQSVFKAIKK
jgi:photosystem II stability/assembly factor-like uncharacterized protein